MRFRKSAVGGPGRMPGMNPPFFRRLSAVRVGSHWFAVLNYENKMISIAYLIM